MITSTQIRAARTMLRWTAQDLADHAGIGVATVRNFEGVDGVPKVQTRILMSVKSTLEQAGIEFIGTPDCKPGIRLNK